MILLNHVGLSVGTIAYQNGSNTGFIILPVVVGSVSATNATFTATQTSGISGTTDSTGIVLTFDQAVTGLTASDITITDGTGSVTNGTLTGSGTTWTIALSSVSTEDNVTVSVGNFGTFNVTTTPQTVAVYKNATAPSTEGNVIVSVVNFEIFNVITSPQTRTVDKASFQKSHCIIMNKYLIQ